MADRRKIEEIRARTGELDLEILKLLERRARLAKEIGALRAEVANPVLLQRERLAALASSASGELPPESILTVFKAIHAVCASLEGPPRIAFVGPEGSFGFVATRQTFGPGVLALAVETPAQAFDELARGRVDYAIAPYESSQEGPVLSTILALKQTDLVVIGQCEMQAGLALLNRTGNLADIEKVYASAHDHASSHTFLASRLPRASVIDVRSPTIACQFAAEDHGGAALAHDAIGELHGLAVVLPNVGDEPDLRMRFAVIGTRPAPRSGNDVTSLVFTLNDEPGALLAVLGYFAKRGINVKNVMSRPVVGEGWDYIFYADVLGHATDRVLVAAFDDIKKSTRFFKVLGSYPAQS